MVVDYTKFAVGTAVSAAGVIVKCPMCGRNGEERASESKHAKAVIVHRVRIDEVVRPPRKLAGDDARLSAAQVSLPGVQSEGARPRPSAHKSVIVSQCRIARYET